MHLSSEYGFFSVSAPFFLCCASAYCSTTLCSHFALVFFFCSKALSYILSRYWSLFSLFFFLVFLAFKMRKPHALTASIAHSSRLAQLPPSLPQLWSRSSNRASLSALPARSPTLKGPSPASSAFPQVARAESGEDALAPRLFNLLQLQLRTSLLQTSIVGQAVVSPLPRAKLSSSSSSSAQMTRSSQLSSGTASMSALQRLRDEVHALDDLLLSHYDSQRQRKAANLYAAKTQGTVHQRSSSSSGSSSGGRRSTRDSRAPVQLIPIPSDAEQTWLQPLQLDIVQNVMRRLALIERLYAAALKEEGEGVARVQAPLSRPRSSKTTDCCSDSGGVRPHTIDAQTENALFFQACVPVVAIVAVLCSPYEGGAQPLACLVNVLRASAAAGAPVTPSTLIDAVTDVCRRDMPPQATKSDQDRLDAESPSALPFPWCSCVPWLLHRYAVAQQTTLHGQDQVDWSAASAWMTTAADRVCATQANELLNLPSANNGGLACPSTAPQRASATMFGPWQRVLNKEMEPESMVVASADGKAASLSSSRTNAAFFTGDAELQAWLVGEATERRGAKETMNEGSLQPYWLAVVREMHSSGAEAMSALLFSIASVHATAKHHGAERRTKANAHRIKPRMASHPTTAALLKDLQFHAVGSYVSLRRITSSLQRHRRLAPLLQVHALVSGYQPTDATAAAQPRSSDGSSFHARDGKKSSSALVNLSSESSAPTTLRSGTFQAAAQRRRSVLTGELMGVGAEQQQLQQRDSHLSTTYHQQVRQAGVMLWREVALLDAYTLITLGHVSEHAVDVTALEKSSVLQQLAWIQQECIQHLRTLEESPATKRSLPGSETSPTQPAQIASSETGSDAINANQGSYRLSHRRTRVLLSSLTPRTRDTLMEKLREGLRLSAKVLARLGEAKQICQLYQLYPGMGASWEIGRALLQCGHYDAAVTVLQMLLGSSSSASSSASTASSLFSSSAVAVRQLLLEAVQGAASALVAQQHDPQPPQQSTRASSGLSLLASSPVSSLGTQSKTCVVAVEDRVEDSARGAEGEVEAPLPAELRARLHSLYTHSTSFPVPLPLCLHAVMLGLVAAGTSAHVSSSIPAGLPWDVVGTTLSQTPPPQRQRQQVVNETSAASPDEELRRTAVLCTYVLRCHLVEQPSCGLLSKTVEFWASLVARYLCRRGESERSTSSTSSSSSSASVCGSLRLSTTDRYVREVAVRLLYGYPHLPVARLLLTRLLQQQQCAATTASSSATPAPDAGTFPPRQSHNASSTSSEVKSQQEDRAAATVQWLLRVLFRFAEDTQHTGDVRLKAYPVCTPGVAATVAAAETTQEAVPWWNANFTERYTQDTLELMPRIALEHLTCFLRDCCNTGTKTAMKGLQHVLERVQVALRRRVVDDATQQQPWQCTTCYLWNSRYTSECKRCRTLATSLLQCRTCGLFTSSAGYRASRGLSCEVCGTALVCPAGDAVQVNRYASSSQDGHRVASSADASPEQTPYSLLNECSAQQKTAVRDGPTTLPREDDTPTPPVDAATVTGSGRPASLFRDSVNVLRVVPLRPWTCTHCRTDNEAQHAFYCRSCGRPPPAMTDMAKDITTESAPCGCCGYLAKTMEGLLSPWCERCGSLHERLQHLLLNSNAASAPAASRGGGGGAAAELRSPTLWWCAECAASLNPWTRMRCGLCGAGRPAAARSSGLPGVSGAASSSAGQDCPITAPSFITSLADDAASQWQVNAAAPYIAVPWSMQPCARCAAPNRVGAHHCWRCGSEQTLPATVKYSIATSWQHWLTQVTHAVVLSNSRGRRLLESKGVEEATEGEGGSIDFVISSHTRSQGAPVKNLSAAVTLLLPRTQRWVCLKEGCLHLNCTNAAHDTDDTAFLSHNTPVYCAACHASRRHAEVFNPFHDRLCWRRAGESEEKKDERCSNVVADDLNSCTVVEAFLLPRNAPRPGEALVVEPIVSERNDRAACPVCVLRRARVTPAAVSAVPACACCGGDNAAVAAAAAEGNGDASPAASLPRSFQASASRSLRMRSSFLVTVCESCGACSWGRSCAAYEPMIKPSSSSSSLSSSVYSSLLPGEEALALRMLLRSLAQCVQQALIIAEEAQRQAKEGKDGQATEAATAAAAAQSKDKACESSPDLPATPLALDWAWFSRHVLSAVQLLSGDRVSIYPARRSTETGGAVALEDTPMQRAEVQQSLRDALLPWRGCDVASVQQLCSAEPRVAVLSDGVGTVHSALLDVREVLENLCRLVELRMHAVPSSSSTYSSSRPRRSRRSPAQDAKASMAVSPPPCLQDAWARRLVLAALELIDVVNRSTVCDEIGFTSLRRLCLLLRPHELADIDTETKWRYLQEMKLRRPAILHDCVQCQWCLTNHAPDQPCAAL